jgi:hypothetical protein
MEPRTEPTCLAREQTRGRVVSERDRVEMTLRSLMRLVPELARPAARSRSYAFTTPTGRSRATTRESLEPSHERTTSDTSSYA